MFFFLHCLLGHRWWEGVTLQFSHFPGQTVLIPYDTVFFFLWRGILLFYFYDLNALYLWLMVYDHLVFCNDDSVSDFWHPTITIVLNLWKPFLGNIFSIFIQFSQPYDISAHRNGLGFDFEEMICPWTSVRVISYKHSQGFSVHEISQKLVATLHDC